MAEAPLPANEQARLEALRRYRILDSEPEQAFDDLTALAAQICGTPMALICFVDQHRQWFKSAYGMSQTQTPRDVALCAHAILDAAPVVVVPDTQKDPRFAGTPLVVGGARIAGYAAAVLRDGDCALGTLCVMDRQPLSLTAGQKDALGRLAHQVMAQLSLRESVALLKADIQLRTEVERKLAASERLYRDLVDNALGLICTHEMDGTLRMVNLGAEQLLGYARDEMVGRNLRDFIPAKHHASFEQYLDAMQRSPQFNGLLSVTARDGRHVTMACQNFRFESPNGPYIVGHGVDVTERAKVNSMNRRFAAVLDVTTDGVTMADAKLRPVYLNRAGREMTGVGLDEDISRLDFLAAYGSGGAADIIKAGVAAAMEDGTWAGENTLRHRDGREIAVSQVVLAPRNAAGDVEFIATIARDISERKQAESSLLQAREDALAASRMKSEFVANMSHEIRTPINGVIGLTMLLLETPLTAEQREYAEGVTQSAEILQTIVNDVLDLSKIEAGKLAIDPFEFELKPMIAGALAPVVVKAQAKQLSIDVHFGPSLPEWVIGDPRHIRQILINLVDNAVKFTERGAIRVAVEGVASLELTSRIQFSVTDSGVGIPEEKLHCIFEKFTQADSSTTRKFGGTGLGLAICQQLVALMHGEIGATSVPGHGSTFCFTLPLGTKEIALVSPPAIPAPVPVQAVQTAQPVQPAEPVQPVQPARPLHVLVVEDNRINQTVAVRRLQNAGCTVEVAENGEVAVRCVDAQHFDVVFMDCQMPVMDGYEATRQIRRRPEHAGLPIVAMTASAMEGDRERCLEAGMTDYLSKPLKAAVVEAVLEGLRRVALDQQPAANAPTLVGVLDEAAIRSLFDDDVEAMLELMALVRSDLPKYAARLLTHVEQGEWIEVARVAHTIKGAASNVSGMAVVEAAQAVEHAARGEDVATLPVAAAQLTAAIDALVEAMTAWSRRLEASRRADAA